MVDEAVLQRRRGGVPAVVQRVLVDPLVWLPGVLGDRAEHGLHRVPQVVGLQLKIDRGAADAGRPLVHEDPRMRQREPPPLRAGRQQELARTGRPAEYQRGHLARDQPHHVTDRQHGRHRPAGGVDPQRDPGVRIGGGQRQQLRHQQRPVVVVKRIVEHENALVQQLLARCPVEQRRFRIRSHASTVPEECGHHDRTLLTAATFRSEQRPTVIPVFRHMNCGDWRLRIGNYILIESWPRRSVGYYFVIN